MGKKGLVFGISIVLFAALGWEAYGRPTYDPGTREYKLDLRVFGLRRSYLLHIPQGYDRIRPLPLILVLHGGFGNGSDMEKETGFSEIADRENFFVAYPNGFGLFGRLQHWNAGHCCGFSTRWGVDDVGFISTVIQQISRHVQVDSSRIYIVGYSNGGMLGYLYAARNPDIVAAVAGIAATIGSRSSPDEPELRIDRPRAPVPVIAFHGLSDETVPYGGGRLSSPYWYVSVRESMLFWVEANQCAAEPIREEMMGGRIIKYTWNGKEKGTEVVLCTLKGWGHSLPTRPFAKKLSESDPLRDLHAPEIIWEFFKAHSKRPATSHPGFLPNGLR
jgi:polyhydroxybutyrate depolymerase